MANEQGDQEVQPTDVPVLIVPLPKG